MKVEVEIDRSCTEPVAIIRAASVSEEVQRAAELLADIGTLSIIPGFRDGSAHLLNPARIRRIYASGGKVYAVTDRGEYILRMRLYEAEKKLAHNGFIRISHSEILNLQEVEKFDLSLSGTILVVLSDGSTAYVSRRYVPRIREVIGM